MSERRTLVILNPSAAQGRAGEREAEIRAAIEEKKLNYELVRTEGVGHAIELAAGAAARGFQVVVAAGGDGTVNETVNGLMSSCAELTAAPETAAGLGTGSVSANAPIHATPLLGVLCVGRGNDFAYGAAVPTDLSEAVALIANDRPRPLDVGLIKGGDFPNGKFFVNGIGIGFDTIVGLEAKKMRRVHGFMAYVFGALKTLAIYPAAPTVSLAFNDKLIQGTSHQISIMNGKRMGGAFFMAPNGDNADGLLDLCMADSMTRRQMLGLMYRYTKGTQAEDPLVRTGRASRFIVEAPNGGLTVHADGETICLNGKRLDIRCLPSRLALFCGRDQNL